MRLKILLAEDEADLRQLLAVVLERENFIVLSSRDAAEAVHLLQNHRGIDVLLTDVQLGPGMNGVELAQHVLQQNPTIRVLLISGFPDSEILAAQQGLPFLRKPFLPTALIEKVWNVLKIPAQSGIKPKQGKDCK